MSLVEKTTGRGISVKAAKFYMNAGKKGLGIVAKTKKHEIIKITGAEKAEAIKLLQASRKKQVSDLEKKGIPARKILKAMGVSGG